MSDPIHTPITGPERHAATPHRGAPTETGIHRDPSGPPAHAHPMQPPVHGHPMPPPYGTHRPGPPAAVPPWGPQDRYPSPTSGYPPPPPWPPLPVKTKRKRGWVIAGVVLIASAGGAIGAWMAFGMSAAERDITATVRAFKAAITSGDLDAVTAQMCAEEAALLDGLHLPPGTPPPSEGSGADKEPAAITDIKVKGTVAAGTLTDTPNAGKKVYFRKVGEQWKVCSFAKADFESAA